MELTLNHRELALAVERVLPIVPSRPSAPYESQFHVNVSNGSSQAFATFTVTDGIMLARVTVPALAGDGTDLIPASLVGDMVKLTSAEHPVKLDTTDRAKALFRAGPARFTFPTLSDPEFPVWPSSDDDTPSAELDVATLVEALSRVQYAMGGPDTREENRMVQVRGNRVSAYSGRRVQEATIKGDLSADQEILILDHVLSPLVRFLKSGGIVGTCAIETFDYIERNAAGKPVGKPVPYISVSTGDASIAFPSPGTPFVDLSRTWEIAATQRESAGEVKVHRPAILEALRAARLQANPRDPVVFLDLLEKGIRVSARKDDSNEFETIIAGSEYSGDEPGRVVAVSIDDLQAMLEACSDQDVSLHVSPAKFAQGSLRPMIQVEDAAGARALIPQADTP